MVVESTIKVWIWYMLHDEAFGSNGGYEYENDMSFSNDMKYEYNDILSTVSISVIPNNLLERETFDIPNYRNQTFISTLGT